MTETSDLCHLGTGPFSHHMRIRRVRIRVRVRVRVRIRVRVKVRVRVRIRVRVTVLQKWTTPCHLDGPCGAQLTAMSCMTVKKGGKH